MTPKACLLVAIIVVAIAVASGLKCYQKAEGTKKVKKTTVTCSNANYCYKLRVKGTDETVWNCDEISPNQTTGICAADKCYSSDEINKNFAGMYDLLCCCKKNKCNSANRNGVYFTVIAATAALLKIAVRT